MSALWFALLPFGPMLKMAAIKVLPLPLPSLVVALVGQLIDRLTDRCSPSAPQLESSSDSTCTKLMASSDSGVGTYLNVQRRWSQEATSTSPSRNSQKTDLPEELLDRVIDCGLELCQDPLERQRLRLSLTNASKRLARLIAPKDLGVMAFRSLGQVERATKLVDPGRLGSMRELYIVCDPQNGSPNLCKNSRSRPGELYFLPAAAFVHALECLHQLQPLYNLLDHIDMARLASLTLDLRPMAMLPIDSILESHRIREQFTGLRCLTLISLAVEEVLIPFTASKAFWIAPNLEELHVPGARLVYTQPDPRPSRLRVIRAAEIDYVSACNLFRGVEGVAPLEEVRLDSIDMAYRELRGWPYAPWAINRLYVSRLQLLDGGMHCFTKDDRLFHAFSDMKVLVIDRDLDPTRLLHVPLFFALMDRLRVLRIRFETRFEGNVGQLATCLAFDGSDTLQEVSIHVPRALGYDLLDKYLAYAMEARRGRTRANLTKVIWYDSEN